MQTRQRRESGRPPTAQFAPRPGACTGKYDKCGREVARGGDGRPGFAAGADCHAPGPAPARALLVAVLPVVLLRSQDGCLYTA